MTKKVENGPAVEGADLITPTNSAIPEEERIILSPDQAQLFATLFAQSKEIQERIQFALVSAGLGGMDIVSGELDASDPHFMVRKSDNGIIT